MSAASGFSISVCSESQRDLSVIVGGHSNDTQIQILCDKRVDVRQDRHPARRAMHVTRRISDADKVNALKAVQHADMIAAHHAHADNPCAQGTHQLPAFATVLTASVTR